MYPRALFALFLLYSSQCEDIREGGGGGYVYYTLENSPVKTSCRSDPKQSGEYKLARTAFCVFCPRCAAGPTKTIVVWSLSGHCPVTVRSLSGHCSV